MRDEEKSKAELIHEVKQLRRKLAVKQTDNSLYSHHQVNHQSEYDNDRWGDSEKTDPKYHTLVNSAVEAICVTQDGVVKFVNPSGAHLIGYSQEELLESPFARFAHPDDLEELGRAYFIRIQGGHLPPGQRFRIINADGEIKWVESFSTTIVWDDRPAVLSCIRDVSKHVIAEELLREARDELDRRVRERTAELQELNNKLILEISQREQAEEKLRLSEENYRDLFENATDTMYTHDLVGNFTSANKAAGLLMGVEGEQFLKLNMRDVIVPEDLTIALSNLQRKTKEGADETGPYEIRIRRLDGAERWVEVRSRIMKKDGQPWAVHGIARDITESKLAAEALRESEAKYRTLIEFAPDGVFVQVGDRIEFANSAMANLMGAESVESLYGLHVMEMVHPEYQEIVRERITRNIDLGEPVPLFEQKLVRLDGTIIDVEVVGAPISYKGQKARQVLVRDITDRKRAEDELKRLFAGVEHAGETILITGPTGAIVYVNPAFETTTGYSREESLGKNPRIFKSGKHDSKFYEDMWSTLTKGRIWRGQFTNLKKDGTSYKVKATISPIKDVRGEIVNYVAVMRDVTAETTLQQQLLQAQKMEAVGTLAGGIAHDFNNLLMVILGYTDLLYQKLEPNDPDRETLLAIRDAARDGSDLVKRILAFSRKVESKISPINLNAELRRIEILLMRAMPKMIDIELLLAGDLKTINADPAQIEQIVLNLAVNAHQAMPNGGRLVIETRNVTLSREYCRQYVETAAGEYVLLTVSDTGMGMDPEVMDRIFEPFFTTKENSQGTGLGLSMVHGIVAQHGGHIRCYSEPNVGTSFKVYFPASADEVDTGIAETREMPAFGTETILLVDDDERVRHIAKKMLKLAGYEVITANNGLEALILYKNNKEQIDLVILDLIMPGMGGHQCLHELLAVNPQVKVLISSGYSENGPMKNVAEGSAKGFIAKPYDMKEILRVVRKVLDKDQLS